MEQQPRLDAALAGLAFGSAAEGMVVTDAQGTTLQVNPAFERLTGYAANELYGHALNILKSGSHPPEFYADMKQRLGDTGRWQGEIRNRHKSGREYSVWLSIGEVRDDQGVRTHYVGVLTDIGKVFESRAEWSFLATHDAATGLPNRRLFDDRFEQAVRRALSARRQMALLFIDLDRGQGGREATAADAGLLVQAARQLAQDAGTNDTLARLGDSEFVLLVEDIDGPRGASVIADKMLRAFNLPFLAGEDKVFVSASVGICMFPVDGHDLGLLLSAARTAMREARLQGRNTYRFYSPQMSAYAGERLMLEALLRQAIANNELSLKYQPQFDATSLKLVGVESLLRWSNLALGMIGPDRFVPVAEDIGLIHPIGEWVLRQACAQFIEWQRQGVAPLTLSVNISARQIAASDFVEMVASVLHDSGLDPALLDLEITESVLNEVPYVVHTIEALRAIGVRISIDDFGTGVTALGNLAAMSVRRLKIDNRFVHAIGRDPGNDAIVRSIVGLARTFGIQSIAEAVETEAQADFLRNEGCQQIQGHLLGHAVAAEDFPAFVRGPAQH